MCDSSKAQPLRGQVFEDLYTEVITVKTPRCGSLNVHVQGDISMTNPRKPVFLTVHDVGSTYLDFVQFAARSCMTSVSDKSMFLHIEVPGQVHGVPDLPEDYKFPTLDDLALDMADVLHYFKYVLLCSFLSIVGPTAAGPTARNLCLDPSLFTARAQKQAWWSSSITRLCAGTKVTRSQPHHQWNTF